MKNTINPNQMLTVKVASKELNISKGKIKDMIKNKEIVCTSENGVCMVNIEEIKKVIKNNSIGKFKCSDLFIRIAKITLKDFQTMPHNKHTDGIISDMSDIIKNKHIKMFNIQNIIPYIYSCGRYKNIELKVLKNPTMEFIIDSSKKDSIGIEHFFLLNEIRNNFTISNPMSGVYVIQKNRP